MGHISRNCPSRTRSFRQLGEIPETTKHQSQLFDLTSEPEINSESHTYHNGSKCSANTVTKQKIYPDDVEQDYKYIMGESSVNSYAVKARVNPMTVLTHRNNESLSNKPVILGKISALRTKLFLDSGAEVNVLDANYAKSVLKINLNLIKKTDILVRCANDSRLQTIGTCRLPVDTGLGKKQIDFVVVNKVLPAVVIGIKGMKSLGISLNPKNSCAVIKGVEIPFMAKVNSSVNSTKNIA